jgi:hypothetical protein
MFVGRSPSRGRDADKPALFSDYNTGVNNVNLYETVVRYSIGGQACRVMFSQMEQFMSISLLFFTAHGQRAAAIF